MIIYPKIHKLLRDKGLGALPLLCETEFTDEFYPVNLDSEDNGYQLVDRIMPLFAAAHLGYAPHAIGAMMTALKLNLMDVDRGFDQGNLWAIGRQQGKYKTPDPDVVDSSLFDGIVFLQQIALAYNVASPDPDAALAATKTWLCRTSTRMLAAMSLGIPELSAKALMDEQAEQVAAGLDLELIDTAAIDVAEVCLNTTHPVHLPNRSLTDFFELTGAFSDHVLRKRMGSGFFWEQLIAQSTDDEMKTLMLDHVLSVHLGHSPAQVKQMLLALECSTLDDLDGISGLQVYEHLFCQLQHTTLSPLLSEEAFVIELLSTDMIEAGQSLLANNHMTFAASLPEAEAILRKMFEDPGTLYQRIMLSQMHDSSIAAPLGHFMLWGKLKDAQLGRQVIDPDVATRYITHMASQLQTLRYPGYQQTPELELCYDAIGQSMRQLGKRLAHLVDYTALKELPEQQREDLILWDFNIKELGLVEGRVATKRLEMDLGL